MKITSGGIGTVASGAVASSLNAGKIVNQGTLRDGNKIPAGYSNFEGGPGDFSFAIGTGSGFTNPGAPHSFEWDDNDVQDHTVVEVDRASGIGVNGPHTLRIVMRPRGLKAGTDVPNDHLDWVVFGERNFVGKEVNLEYTFRIPTGKLWEFSYQLRANTTIDVGVSQVLYCGNNTHFPHGSYFDASEASAAAWETVEVADTWEKKTVKIDLRPVPAYYDGTQWTDNENRTHDEPAGDALMWTKDNSIEGGGPGHPHENFHRRRLWSIGYGASAWPPPGKSGVSGGYSDKFHPGEFANATYETSEWTANADVLLMDPGDAAQIGIVLYTNASSTHGIEYHIDDMTLIEAADQSEGEI